jgi:predicted outer membrane protein
MNKGRAYGIPGIGLAGDWPGGWTQTYAQVDTEAGPRGFDKQYFVQQVAGLSQLAGEFMGVKPIVIDLGWGQLKSALISLSDSSFVAAQNAATERQTLIKQYTAAFRDVEAGTYDGAKTTLKDLRAKIAATIVTDKQSALSTLVNGQIAKLG